MTKDRLQEMRKIMQEGSNEGASEKGTTENPVSLNTFFEHTRAVRLEIDALKRRVNELKALLRDSQQWANAEARKALERKIEEEKLIIASSAKTIRNDLKSIKNTPGEAIGITVIQRIKDVQLNAVLKELNEVLRNYLNCLVEHREKSVKILKDMLEVKGEQTADIDELLEEGKIAIFTNNLLIGDMEEKYNLKEAEDRRDGIMKIESSILEIRNLFNELALIVDLQADKIQVVEKLVDENLTKIEKGNSKLTSTNKLRKKVRRRKITIALICCCFIVAVPLLLSMV